jgi:TolB-like protein/Flp pilus assembly protein TadD
VPGSEWTEGPGLIIGRFVDLSSPEGKSAQSIGVAESLAQAFSQFPGLNVYGPISLTADDVGSAVFPAAALKAHYLLEGSVRVERGWLRVSARLFDLETSRLVVATTADRDLEQFTGFQAEGQLASEIAAQLGDYRGEVQRDLGRPGRSARLPGTYQAMLHFYDYLDHNTRVAAAAAEQALQAALRDEPGNPQLLTMLSSTQVALAETSTSDDAAAALAAAKANAAQALSIRPSGLAYTALARAALLESDFATCHQEARRAIAAEPTHPTVLFLAGYLLAHHGDWTEALALINSALRLNPRMPTYCFTLRALGSYLDGRWADALSDAADTPEPHPYLGALVRALSLHHLGQHEAAVANLAAAMAASPQLEHVLASSALYPEQVRQALLDGIAEIRELPIAAELPPPHT